VNGGYHFEVAEKEKKRFHIEKYEAKYFIKEHRK
jgi:hypothetical protein